MREGREQFQLTSWTPLLLLAGWPAGINKLEIKTQTMVIKISSSILWMPRDDYYYKQQTVL